MAVAGYRDLVARALARHASTTPEEERSSFVHRLDYSSADMTSDPQLGELLRSCHPIVYLALPPAVYPAAVRALHAGGLPHGSRVVVEKPFGRDRGSARALHSLLHDLVEERDIFRADHFLYHQVIHDLLAVRFASSAFVGLFDRDHIAAVDLVWEESSGVEGRIDFYDANGALIDMVQSHLLQVLTLAAMEPCRTIDAESFRDGRVDLLRHVRAPQLEEVDTHTVRGRYTSGHIDGVRVRGYAEEKGVDPRRGTETFAMVRLHVDTPRWRGVPFTIRTGKRLGNPRREICFRLRDSSSGSWTGNRLPQRLRFSSHGAALDVPVSSPTGFPAVVPASATLLRPERPLPPSALLMRDVLGGDPTFCVRDDEVDECWRIVEPVIERWKEGRPPHSDYPAGSAGPVR